MLIGVFSPLHAAPNTTLFAISLPGSDDWPGSATAALDQLRARSVAARLLGQLPAVSGEQRVL
ncbi:hypothetical protein, partial [Gemmatimonas sp.]|uniref:hypothetical protein n=1 Tax=Gemmatimonas sp. TaxID=1962908 RepID=UPI003F70E9AA